MSELGILMGEMIGQATKGTSIIKASVVTPPPNLTIEFDGQVIPSEQIYCSNYLLPHYHRDYKINGVIDEIKIDVSSYDYDNNTQDAMGHKISKLTGKGKYEGSGTYKSHKDIWFEDTLKKGDEVLVVVLGVYYVVVTRIVKMPSKAIEGV
ncbi:DUF2577 family protein [Fusobacterium polymorphum]|uniref:DUF2577 domain-containing protein n=1 Tax=Fusobacterium nucleatum subsp. polymorphum TaxID=76857 RepID=A0A2C6A261_FUSNP|nr:DUF2577 family protein [Fusobacterium polymorphum]PHI05750.1 hypothetical protein CBG54_01070 [Fusobacterium polymorphum]